MKKQEDEMKFVEWYAKYIWPVHRVMARPVLSKRCSRCTLSENCSPLNNGLCEFCHNTEATSHERKGVSPDSALTSELEALLRSSAGTGTEQFDCLVLCSGGKDSINLVYELRERFPDLRLLMVLVDHSFLPPIAASNTERVARALQVPLLVVQLSPQFYEKAIRHMFLHLNGRTCVAVVDQLAGDLFYDIGCNIAAQNKIPLVMLGLQGVQAETYIHSHGFEAPLEESSVRTHIANIELSTFLTKEELLYFWNGTRWPKQSIPRVLFPYCAWGYQEEDVIKSVTRRGLLKREEISPLITNYEVFPLIGAVDMHRFGYSSFDPEIAKAIRAGLMERQYWQPLLEMQEYAMKKNRFVKSSVDKTLSRLSLTREQLGLPL